MDDHLKNVWPEWLIEEPAIGRGSYGVVYKAVKRERDLESYAAVKVISIPRDESEYDTLIAEGLTADNSKSAIDKIVNGFVNEIKLMETFKGVQNIVSVEDYKVCEKEQGFGYDIFIRMELLSPFAKHLANKDMDEAAVIKLGTDICTALELLEKKNVIHRDIKPQNIFVNQFGDFKLGDFGIARSLEGKLAAYTQRGTFGYMAPEVAHGGEYDKRADLYSLGLVLYYCLNKNRLPFLDTQKQLLDPFERDEANRRRLSGEPLPAPCMASEGMAEIILRACEYDPDDRFASPSEMKQALLALEAGDEEALKGMLPSDTKAKRTRKAKKKSKRKAAVIAAACAAAVLLAALGLFVLPKLRSLPADNPDAQPETTAAIEDNSDLKAYADSASELPFGSIAFGNTTRFRTPAQGDWYRMELAEDSIITLDFGSDRQANDDEYWRMSVRSKDALNAVIWETVVSGDETSKVSPQIPLGKGAYFVVVEQQKAAGTYYTLTASCESNDGTWEVEGNNTPETANRAELDTKYSGVILMPSYAGEKDWYIFTVEHGMEAKVSFETDWQSEPEPAVYDLEVCDSSMSVIQSAQFTKDTSSIWTDKFTLQPGQYYICISRAERAAEKPYSFEIRYIDLLEKDEIEPNDDRASANEMEPFIYYAGVFQKNDVDVYKLKLESDCLIRINFSYRYPLYSLIISLRAEEYDWAAADNSLDDFYTGETYALPVTDTSKSMYSDMVSLSAGIYYLSIEQIMISDSLASAGWDYSLMFEVIEQDVLGDTEPNDAFGDATFISGSTQIEGIITGKYYSEINPPESEYFLWNHDDDIYCFELTEAREVSFDVVARKNCTIERCELYKSDTLVEKDEGWADSVIAHTAWNANRGSLYLTPGFYYFVITGVLDDACSSGTYSLRIDFYQELDLYETEPNDTVEEANELPLDHELCGMKLTENPDCYRFTVEERTEISVYIYYGGQKLLSPNRNPVSLLDESNNIIWKTKNAYDPDQAFVSERIELEPGTYYLVLGEDTDFLTFAYLLEIITHPLGD